jgi:hypothetical protein
MSTLEPDLPHFSHMRGERQARVEAIAQFLAFYIDGHDPSWGHLSPELVEDYHHKAEGLMLCAEGHDPRTFVMPVRSRFTYTDADLERAAHALLNHHGNPHDSIPVDEREAALANATGDAEAVLDALDGEWAANEEGE